MGVFEPKKGYPFSTEKFTLGGTVSAGDACELGGSGTPTVAAGACTTVSVIACTDGVSGDVISCYTAGTFKTTNTSASAMLAGATCYLEANTGVDEGSAGDLPFGICVGPSASNAATAEAWVKMVWGMIVKP